MTRNGAVTAAFLMLWLAAFLVVPGAAQAAQFRAPESEIDPESMRVDEKEFLGVKLDSDLRFIDQNGQEFGFQDLRGKPFILVLSYYNCDGFCPSYNADLRNVLEKVEELDRVSIGKDFSVVTLSFDKNDDPEVAASFQKELGLTDAMAAGWRVSVFTDGEKIKPFTSSIGYKFFWSPADRQFFHPNAYFFISPKGRVIRILHGSVAEAKDMQLAILDTKFSRMKPTEIIDMAVSLCYSYNYKEGKYGLNYPLFIAFGSLFTGITAFAYAAGVTRKNKRKQTHNQARGSTE